MTLGHEFSARRSPRSARASTDVAAGRPRLRRRLLALRASARPASRAAYNLCRYERLDRPLLRRRLRAAGPLPRLLRGAAARRGAATRSARCSSRWPSACTRSTAAHARAGETAGRDRLRPDRRLHGAGRRGDRARRRWSASSHPGGGRGPRRRASPSTCRSGETRDVAARGARLTGGGAQIVVDCSGARAGAGSGAGDDPPRRPHRRRRDPEAAGRRSTPAAWSSTSAR